MRVDGNARNSLSREKAIERMAIKTALTAAAAHVGVCIILGKRRHWAAKPTIADTERGGSPAPKPVIRAAAAGSQLAEIRRIEWLCQLPNPA